METPPASSSPASEWIIDVSRASMAESGGNIPGSVRHQSFWNQWRLKLRESLAHLFGLIMRRAGGDASVALRVSFV
jgi:hypothetical protein